LLRTSKLTLFANYLALEWVTTLNAAEFAGTSSERLCSVTTCERHLACPLGEYLITVSIAPSASPIKRDCISVHFTDVGTHGSFDP
jgi:hypothetical protein